ncbi:MAG: hypothetical protein H0W44_09600 [Gammaproteobacteria bacterium]|nr:hypothetical protein [Gammaproteobacteria bacterium]
MRITQKLAIGLACVISFTALNGFAVTKTYFEQTVSFAFDDGGVPGRSTGDTLYFGAIFIDQVTGAVKGNKQAVCNTVYQDPSNGHFWSWCHEVINWATGVMYTQGMFDEIAYENYQPEDLDIIAGSGKCLGATGVQLLQQVRFPDQAIATFVVPNPAVTCHL